MTNQAISLRKREHISHGNSDVMAFDLAVPETTAWDGGDVAALEEGCYHFALSCIRAIYLKGRLPWIGEDEDESAIASLALISELKENHKIYFREESNGRKTRYLTEAYLTG